MRVLEQDFVQLAPRPVRAPVGYTWQPSLQGSSTTQPLAALTRGGWTNPNGLQRPGLQRVAYFFENGTLRREYWTVLDPTQSNTTVKRDLMTHLLGVTVRYMDQSLQWQDQWPPLTVAGGFAQGSSLRGRPIALEITLDTEDWGKVVRIVEVAGGAPAAASQRRARAALPRGRAASRCWLRFCWAPSGRSSPPPLRTR